jgi:2,5-diamino-6-hydroxy-4-(5-phosphoribosylamino)pyrimidine 1'-reductase
MTRPYVILGGFMSLDGKTAPANRNGRLFTQLMGERLLGRLHQLRAEVDAVLVGSGTVIEDNPRLTVRAVRGKNPLRVVLDSMASSPLQSEIFKIEDAVTIVAVSTAAPAERTAKMVERGVEVMRFDCERTIPLEGLLDLLYQRGVRKLLVEGGSEVRWSFVKERLVDEIFVWITPSVWGGRAAPTFVGGEGYLDIEHSLNLSLKNHEIVDDTMILEYKVSKN